MADTMDTSLTSRARRVAVQRPRRRPVHYERATTSACNFGKVKTSANCFRGLLGGAARGRPGAPEPRALLPIAGAPHAHSSHAYERLRGGGGAGSTAGMVILHITARHDPAAESGHWQALQREVSR